MRRILKALVSWVREYVLRNALVMVRDQVCSEFVGCEGSFKEVRRRLKVNNDNHLMLLGKLGI